ncbi:amino acid ABC transporter substrate-binding protein [Oceanibacterium hippocampi]|uniref:General L-amino acid-binding periplasmic protein AapJ n=1 Tax=Oceanibacterium hippocampi TaxID=745714 RepID=A0A1Y5SX53_9PROT|nr:amino acid ABC transporter substrate-binding protein [Oceanibacterium hippocampi]SLN49890.1 General L-amino acid-binding periplasmic protein AapJ precursor [Oceanibacterium hippocampi]
MKYTSIFATASAAVLMSTAAFAGTLDDVKAKGFVQCGVTTGLAGFAAPNDKGQWEGFDVDFCRAMAAAIFGDPEKVKYTPTTAKERFTALQSGEIDVLARNTTWTLSRDVSLGFEFIGVNFYDGQGFMIRKAMGVKSAKELDGASVCIQTGTTTELNLADYFRSNNMKFTSVVFETSEQIRTAYEGNRCDVYTTDRSGLAAQRAVLANPDEHVVLPEVISKEPLGPLVRHGDNAWGDLARWTLNAMIVAEELGVTSANAAEMKSTSTNPEVRRLLGAEGDLGSQLNVSNDWAYNVVTMVGNYGEVFDRNIGPDTPLQLDRGINALWNKGGILYAPPMR